DDLGAKDDMGEPKPPPDQPSIAKKLSDLLGMGVGGDIEVLGGEPDQHVAHTTAHEVGRKTAIMQPIQYLESVWIDVLSGDRVLGARADHWFHLKVWKAPPLLYLFGLYTRAIGRSQQLV